MGEKEEGLYLRKENGDTVPVLLEDGSGDEELLKEFLRSQSFGTVFSPVGFEAPEVERENKVVECAVCGDLMPVAEAEATLDESATLDGEEGDGDEVFQGVTRVYVCSGECIGQKFANLIS